MSSGFDPSSRRIYFSLKNLCLRNENSNLWFKHFVCYMSFSICIRFLYLSRLLVITGYVRSQFLSKREKKVFLHSRKEKKGAHKARKTRRKMKRDHWRGWIWIGRRMAREGTVDKQVLKIPWKMNLSDSGPPDSNFQFSQWTISAHQKASPICVKILHSKIFRSSRQISRRDFNLTGLWKYDPSEALLLLRSPTTPAKIR